MKEERKIIAFERLIYILLWALVFLFPLLVSYYSPAKDFNRFWHELLRVFPYFILFVVHNLLIFKLFEKRKYWDYFFLTFFLILGIAFVSMFIVKWVNDLTAFHIKLPPPRPGAIREPRATVFLTRFLNHGLMGLLIIGLNAAIKIFVRWFRREHEMEIMQKENAESKLAMLRQQISPHFFMNTLNNIHALIDYNQDKAKDAVVKLSKLMRVLLYESETRDYDLTKELAFLGDYIEIMKIRLHDKVKVVFDIPSNPSDIKIPPLLFINFVENAFKYGVLPGEESEIMIRLYLSDGYIVFETENTYDNALSEKIPGSKMGISNSVKRLELIYRNTYSIETSVTDSLYKLCIKIPVQ